MKAFADLIALFGVTFRLRSYLVQPGNGWPQSHIPERVLLWAMLVSHLLRE